MERKQITDAIKSRLLRHDYPVKSVKWDTGTARWWIRIKVNLPWQTDYGIILGIAEDIKGDDKINIFYT